MPHFETKRHVAFSASQMFDLVADVEAYPEFVPLCKRLVIKERKEDESKQPILIADMDVAYKLFRERFTSHVVLDRELQKIIVTYVDGPFKHLENVWTFEALSETSCAVHFKIDYAFRSRSLSLLMGAMFDRAFRKFSSAFEARAHKIYT